MLRTNLSTRPFYNERATHAVIALAAILVLAITGWNIYKIVTLSRHNTELSARIDQEHAEAQRQSQSAANIRRAIDRDELEQVVLAAREANSLIDQRTFSWTQFFNHIESTMPPDVMLTAVRPTVRDNVTTVNIVVLARRAEDVEELNEKLEATGAFEQVVTRTQDMTEQGLFRVAIDSIYTGLPVEEQSEAARQAAPARTAPAAAPAGDKR